jgi:endonuclease YncB( thermonuclease family)
MRLPSAKPTLTTKKGVEVACLGTEVIDGETVEISGSVRIRLALVNTPEVDRQVFL